MSEKTIGMKIKEFRVKQGFTQESLAVLMFIPKSTLSSYENDKCDISSKVIVELAKVLHTTPGYFYGEEKTTGDPVLDEVISLFSKIDDKKYKRALLEQIRIMAASSND